MRSNARGATPEEQRRENERVAPLEYDEPHHDELEDAEAPRTPLPRRCQKCRLSGVRSALLQCPSRQLSWNRFQRLSPPLFAVQAAAVGSVSRGSTGARP